MNITTILNECKEKGFVILVKNTNREIRGLINEAEGRGYLQKSQPGVYRLTPLGFEVLDGLKRNQRSEAIPAKYNTYPNKIVFHIGNVSGVVKKVFINSTVLFILKYIVAPLLVTVAGALIIQYFIKVIP